MPRTPTPKQLPNAADLRSFLLINRGADVITWLIKGATLTALVYFGIIIPVRETAGKTTIISVLYQTLVNFQMHVVLPYALAAGFGGVWARERRLRKEAVKREHIRVAELERAIDSRRTSSELKE